MDGIATLTLVITSLCIVSSTIFRFDFKSYAIFQISLQEIVDSGPALEDLAPKTVTECTLWCISVRACKSVNYKEANGRCQLIERGKRDSAPYLIKKVGWTYMTTANPDKNISPGCNRQLFCKENTCKDDCRKRGYKCTCDKSYCGQLCDNEITDCTTVYKSGSKQDGVYNIHENGSGVSMSVYCHMTDSNDGWIVIQRRVDDSVDFNRNWTAYKDGFGNLSGNMWIGLDKLHLLAGPGKNAILRIDFKHYAEPNRLFYALYTTFEVGSEAEKYKLVIDGYTGDAGDSMAYHNGMVFSTFDNDDDRYSGKNCAMIYMGGWWYNRCHFSDLNGLFPSTPNASSIYMSWYYLRNSHGNVIFSELKIRYP